MIVSMDKEYRTRAGHEVRIYATDAGGDYPIHGAWFFNGESWESEIWTLDGARYASGATDRLDLIEVKPRIKRTVWLNVYPGEPSATTAKTQEEANRRAMSTRIACVKVEIDCEEGEGL